jgi:hypothetical protein
MAVTFTQEQLDYLASLNGMDDILKKVGSESTKKQLAFNKAENTLAKKSAGGTMGMNIAQGVLGAGQAIGGGVILKKTKAPKYPYELLPNKQLSARLADVQRLQQIGDPIIREKLMRDLVQQKVIADQSARVASGGDVSSYGAQTQANQSRLNDDIRNISASDLAFKSQQGGVLDGLIAQKIAEDKYAHQGRINKFNQVDYPEFARKRAYGENLVNQGIENIFKSVQGATETGSIMARTNQNDKLLAGQEAEMLNAQNQAKIKSGNNIASDNANKAMSPPPYTPKAVYAQNFSNGSFTPSVPQSLNPVQPQPQPLFPSLTQFGLNPSLTAPYKPNMPTDYSAYKDKVSKLTDEQILSGFNGRINPLTGLPYSYSINDVPKIRQGMTDGIYGDKHRVAQDLLSKYSY